MLREFPIIRAAGALTHTRLAGYLRGPFQFSWDGSHKGHGASFCAVLTAESLGFLVSAPLPYRNHPGAQPQEFVRGLWEYDVGEIFIADDDSGAYQEFNLAPNGAWWSALFAGYRIEDTESFRMPVVSTFAAIEGARWCASIIIERASLSVRCEFSERSRLNVCFIEGEARRRYLSFSTIDSLEPDFHRREYFAPIALKS